MFELHWIEFLIYLLMAYAWGRWVQWRMTLHKMLDDPERFTDILSRYAELKNADQADDGQKQIAVRVEWLDDQCYLYRLDTNEFLGQGTDIDSAVRHIDSRGIEGEFVIPKEMATKPTQT